MRREQGQISSSTTMSSGRVNTPSLVDQRPYGELIGWPLVLVRVISERQVIEDSRFHKDEAISPPRRLHADRDMETSYAQQALSHRVLRIAIQGHKPPLPADYSKRPVSSYHPGRVVTAQPSAREATVP